jgi:hypothetical protein
VRSREHNAPCEAVYNKNTKLLNATVGGEFGNHCPLRIKLLCVLGFVVDLKV